uniref:Uncharacterized protein n=1 Tax=Siphoviridae sp. ct9UA16 TaxID=2827793 RepID=A0A8S5TM57_9CAUD|nr:MAG TPA: hypothetical protein [Siphoviridae sp. ct9UA16]
MTAKRSSYESKTNKSCRRRDFAPSLLFTFQRPRYL